MRERLGENRRNLLINNKKQSRNGRADNQSKTNNTWQLNHKKVTRTLQDTGQVKFLIQPVWSSRPRSKIHLASACSRPCLWSPPLVGGLIDCVAQNFNSACKCQEVVRLRRWRISPTEASVPKKACSQLLYFTDIKLKARHLNNINPLMWGVSDLFIFHLFGILKPALVCWKEARR